MCCSGEVGPAASKDVVTGSNEDIRNVKKAAFEDGGNTLSVSALILGIPSLQTKCRMSLGLPCFYGDIYLFDCLELSQFCCDCFTTCESGRERPANELTL